MTTFSFFALSMGQTLGFSQTPPANASGSEPFPVWKKRAKHIHLGYLFLCVLRISICSSLVPFFRGNTVQAITTVFPTISVALRFLDARGARALYAMYQTLFAPQEPIWGEHLADFTNYIAQGGSWISAPLFRSFPAHAALLTGISAFSGDIRSLLGEEQKQRYLVVLQNTAEKRPNGGFFGSFALVTIDRGRVLDIEIVDSYLPQYDNPDTSITGPKRLSNFLPDRQIYFVGANKVGFTYHDGAHILNLYEKSYPGKKIRGVIFLRTDMFVSVFPEFLKQFRAWQFANASIDLIRGQARRGKKELYLTSSQNFVKTHQTALIKTLLQHLPDLIHQNYINIYLTDVSNGLHAWLRTAGLTTRCEEDTLYSRESNTAFNKADAFVQKTIVINDLSGTLIQTTSGDRVSLAQLAPGRYQMHITYDFAVPETYTTFMQALEEQYQITLTERERHILVLDPMRQTRGLIYYPKYIRFGLMTGDVSDVNLFETPFAYGATYSSKIPQSPGQATVSRIMDVGTR